MSLVYLSFFLCKTIMTKGDLKLNGLIKGRRILELTQILYQNGEIDNSQKNRIVLLTKNSQRNGDFLELNKLFRSLSYGVVLTNVLEECIQITAQKEGG